LGWAPRTAPAATGTAAAAAPEVGAPQWRGEAAAAAAEAAAALAEDGCHCCRAHPLAQGTTADTSAEVRLTRTLEEGRSVSFQFLPVFCEKIGVFLKNQCYDQVFSYFSFVFSQKRHFWRKYLKHHNIDPGDLQLQRQRCSRLDRFYIG
jgi:hypothetical protein